MSPFKILLVEDEAPKLAHIEAFLKKLDPTIELKVARSVNSGIDEIERNVPDLLLLDMSLPTFDVGERETGGRPQGFGGIEILRHLSYSDIDCPTIIITGYEAFLREAGKPIDLSQIRAELISEFPHLFKEMLHFNSTYDEWKARLEVVLAEIKSKRGI